MQKILTLFFALAVTLSAFAFESGSFKYNVLEEPSSSNGDMGSVEVTGWIKPKSISNPDNYTLSIPARTSYQGKSYRVKRVGKKAFFFNVYAVHMVLSYGIEEICDSAFVQCNYMTTLTLPSSIKKIGNWIVRGCGNYTYCSMAHTTTEGLEIAPNAFVNFGKKILNLSYLVENTDEFKNHPVLSQYFSYIQQEQNICDFVSNDFNYIVTKEGTATRPAEVAIVHFDFANFKYDHEDGKLAFTEKNSKPFSYPDPIVVTQIAPRTFDYASTLKELDFSNVTTITKWGDRALANCDVLNTVKIGSGTLGVNMFAESNKLTTVELGAGVNDVSHNAFNDASSLFYIKVDESNPYLSSYHNHLYNKAQTTLIRVPEGNGQYLNSLPHTVTTIYVNAYRNNPSLKSIRFEYGVKNILTQAFYGCSSLTEVALPSSVTTLGAWVFKGSYNVNDVWINNPKPETVTSSNLFENLSHIALHVPRGKVDAYKSAGWTGFKSYNTGEDAIVPHDYTVNTMGFTVTSTKPEKINGKQFNGRAKVVRSIWNKSITWGSATVPPSITIRNKEYAVTRIDDYAFNLDVEYELRNCENVDTVGSHAFGNQKVTSAELPYVSVIEESAFGTGSLKTVKWGNRLRKIGRYGFSAAPIENDIYLPVGFENLGYRAFEQAKSKILLIPSTLKTIDAQAFNKMKSLEAIIANSPVLFRQSFAFTEVPTSATVYVPVGNVPIAKANGSWKRFSNIQEGSYDFSYGGQFNTVYKMTVTSTEPFTSDGVEYAGKAKYVYNPQAHAVNSFMPDSSEVDKMTLGERRYLMTEIGDSAFAGAQIKEFDFERMTKLERIGRRAFYNGKLTTATMPYKQITFGEDAFYGSTQLTELVHRSPYGDGAKFEGRPFGNNASNFTYYVHYGDAYAQMRSLQNYNYSATEKCSNRVAPCFIASYTTLCLGVDVPLYFDVSEVDAYAVIGIDNATGLLKTQRWSYSENNDGGVILTGLTPGKFYKIERMFTDDVSTNPGWLKHNKETRGVDADGKTYTWSVAAKKFLKIEGTSYIGAGECYLEFENGPDELSLDLFPGKPQGKKGDVNGDGTIDVTDVNLAINVMLGKATKSDYPAADVNGDGTVDVTDVNLIINAMLGK